MDSSPSTDRVTAGRIRMMAYLLGLTSLIAVPLQLLWEEPSDGMHFSYADVAADRDQFWVVLSAFAVLTVVNLPLQALSTMHLVRDRGSRWATIGGVVLLVGAGFQAAGVAAWGSVYYFATHADLDESTGKTVVEAVNDDGLHLYGFWAPGALLVTLGTVLLCVALFRAKVVPVWVPIGLLFIVVTWVIQSVGVLGLLTTIPMTIGALGLAYFVLRSVD